ncbi:MAG: adenine phosphoribosyltransferase, partial [Aeromonas sp.]
MNPETLKFIEASIKTIPDYPKPGILFRDITSLIENAE